MLINYVGENLQPEFIQRQVIPDVNKKWCNPLGTVFYQVQCTLFNIEKDAEIFPAHYTWKVAERGLKMVFMMNKLAINNSC